MTNHAIRKLFYYIHIAQASALIDSIDHIDHMKLFLSFDGEKYQSIADSIVSHRQTFGLANYKDQALTVGCSRNEDADFNGEEKCSFNSHASNWFYRTKREKFYM